MDAAADQLLTQAEAHAEGWPALTTILQALRARLEADERTGGTEPSLMAVPAYVQEELRHAYDLTGNLQWDRPAAIDLLPGDKVVVGGVERELIAVERGLRDGWVLLGWNPDGNSDVSSVWLADGTCVWRHLQSPLDERDTMNMVGYRSGVTPPRHNRYVREGIDDGMGWPPQDS